jgi:hypothetical protein
MATFGVAVLTLALQNDRADGSGTTSSLLAFCVLQFVVIFRYLPILDFAKSLAWGYISFSYFLAWLFQLQVCGEGIKLFR